MTGRREGATVTIPRCTEPIPDLTTDQMREVDRRAIAEFGVPAMDYSSGYALFSQMMIYAYGLMHYYLDSFIWKVTDKQTQKGL